MPRALIVLGDGYTDDAEALETDTYLTDSEETVYALATFLGVIYRAARRPPLRTIASEIHASGSPGQPSIETIRRMLQGDTVPARWPTVEATCLALCNLAGWDPVRPVNKKGQLPLDRAEQLWHAAIAAREFQRDEEAFRRQERAGLYEL
jgi:hypothetical protein